MLRKIDKLSIFQLVVLIAGGVLSYLTFYADSYPVAEIITWCKGEGGEYTQMRVEDVKHLGAQTPPRHNFEYFGFVTLMYILPIGIALFASHIVRGFWAKLGLNLFAVSWLPVLVFLYFASKVGRAINIEKTFHEECGVKYFPDQVPNLADASILFIMIFWAFCATVIIMIAFAMCRRVLHHLNPKT